MKPRNDFRIGEGLVWIRLTQGKETCVDLRDWPAVSQYRWCAYRARHTFYAGTTIKGKRLDLHKLLTGAKLTDHEDGDGLNNCRGNLRGATHSQNGLNCRPHKRNTSDFRGVHRHTRDHCWIAQIRVNKTTVHVGCFDNKVSAALAYDVAAKESHGQFARLNFP